MADMKARGAVSGDSRHGFFYALTAYLLWGFLPVFMKAVAHIPVLEVIAHRILWSVPLAGVVLLVQGRTADIKTAFRNPRMLAMATLTAALIAVNWSIYIWSIANDRAIESALGYYINPLFSIFLGAVLLKEKLERLQLVAIGLAVIAVAVLTWEAGGLPWISLGLAVSWGFYAFFRKTLPVGPNQGFFLEVVLLSPFALAFVIYQAMTGQSHFGPTGMTDVVLLVSCGLVTAIPLMIYANGAKLLKLSTIGIMQYIAPTMIFITAIFVFHEPFSPTKMVAFALIWAALIAYTWSMFSTHRSDKAERLSQAAKG